MKQEIRFKDVKLGETFRSFHTKRAFGGIKIEPLVKMNATDPERVYACNAILLWDCFPNEDHSAKDAGKGIVMKSGDIVEVRRGRGPYRIE